MMRFLISSFLLSVFFAAPAHAVVCNGSTKSYLTKDGNFKIWDTVTGRIVSRTEFLKNEAFAKVLAQQRSTKCEVVTEEEVICHGNRYIRERRSVDGDTFGPKGNIPGANGGSILPGG